MNAGQFAAMGDMNSALSAAQIQATVEGEKAMSPAQLAVMGKEESRMAPPQLKAILQEEEKMSPPQIESMAEDYSHMSLSGLRQTAHFKTDMSPSQITALLKAEKQETPKQLLKLSSVRLLHMEKSAGKPQHESSRGSLRGSSSEAAEQNYFNQASAAQQAVAPSYQMRIYHGHSIQRPHSHPFHQAAVVLTSPETGDHHGTYFCWNYAA